MKRTEKLFLPVIMAIMVFALAGTDAAAAQTKDSEAAVQMPDPGDPDSPELFIPEEGNEDEVYVKAWDSQKEAWTYAAKDEVPHSLPNPNEADSPERVTILDDEGTPRTYIKVSDSEEEGYVYILDEDLSSVIPKTADVSSVAVWIMFGIMAVAAVVVLRPHRKNNA